MGGDQQTARINVSDAEWVEFRTLAMRERRSLADYLAELVRTELGRHDRGGLDSGPSSRRAPAAVPRKNRVRLADQQLLTRLPGPR